MKRYFKICEICGAEFESTQPNAKYCCDDCRRAADKIRYDRNAEKHRASARRRYHRNKLKKKEQAAAAKEKGPDKKPKPKTAFKPVDGTKLPLREAMAYLKEYNKAHGTRYTYGEAVTRGII